MTINLTPQESEKHFYDAMCNGLGELSYYGLQLDFNDIEYDIAKAKLKAATPDEAICLEDVLMEMLRSGNTLWIVDSEDDDSKHPITLQQVHDNVQHTPLNHLMDAINDNDDAVTADCILQTVIFGEVIYG